MTETHYRRRNLRLLPHDYTTPGSYFVTMCIQNRAWVLGEIADGEIQCSPVGQMVENHLGMVVDRYPGIELDSSVLMPNHLHAIINIGWTYGAGPNYGVPDNSSHGGPRLRDGDGTDGSLDQEPTSLFRVMNWFKSATTNENIRRVKTDGWPRFPGKLWQANCYEHIVRDQRDLDRVRSYIAGNPGQWELDTEYSPSCSGFTS